MDICLSQYMSLNHGLSLPLKVVVYNMMINRIRLCSTLITFINYFSCLDTFATYLDGN